MSLYSLQSDGGQVELALTNSTDLSDIQVGVSNRRIKIERLQSLLERLSVTSGRGRLAVDLAGSSSLVSGTGGSPRGEMKLGALEAKVDKLRLEVQTGALSLELAAASQANGFSGLIHAKEALPEVELQLGAASAMLSHASLDTRGDTLRWQAAGDAVVDSLTADFAKGKLSAYKLGHAEVKALQANEHLQLAADALTVDGLDLYVKRSVLEALLRPKEAGAAQAIDVSRVQTLLAELGYAPGPVDGRVGRRTAEAISDFQRREGLVVDGRLSRGLLATLETRVAGAARTRAAPALETETARPIKPTVRLGRFALRGNPVLRFRDDMVTPQVKIDTVIKEAEVNNLDTGKADQRTDLSLVADVNEFTHVKLGGWLAGPGEAADLELKAEVENLELSTYSPYVVELSGVYLESGQLDTVSVAKAEKGALQGKIQLLLDDIAFRPLNEEDAERIADKVGMPLKTAVSLLQDRQGRIALTLPVSGPLSEPEVDISSAVSKAVGGALKKVFPPNMVASMVAGVAKGSGPTFKPIEFSPGSAELDKTGKPYADDVAALLAEHPKLSLRLCGRATAQDMKHFVAKTGVAVPPAKGAKSQAGPSEARPTPDLSEARQALVELAVERKRALRRYLIQEKGADAKRVPECRSTFEAADQGSPRVEISL